jgi:hypothetical protein
MKTIKYFSIVSFAFIFIGVTNGFSKKSQNPNTLMSKIPVVRYQVNIHLASDKPLCNIYWVQIKDENGNLVAPAQIFVPEISQYTFYANSNEKGYNERGTKRTAILTTSPRSGNLECINELITIPAVRFGLFFPGQTYSFDLFPVWETLQTKN